MPTGCYAFFLGCRWRSNNLSFTLLRKDILVCPHHWSSKHFSEVEGLWTFVKLFLYPLTHKWFTNKSRVLTIQCSVGPLSIISLIQWTSVMSCPRERQSRSLQTKLWHKAGELAYSRSRTVKLYCWPYWLVDFTNRYGEKSIARSIAAYQVPEDVNLLMQCNHIWYCSCNS